MSKVAFSIPRVHKGNLRSPKIKQLKNTGEKLRRERKRRRRRRKKSTETAIHSKCFNLAKS